MNKNRIVLIAVLAVIAWGFVATFLTSRSQSQNTDHQQRVDNYVPIVDLYAPAPNDPGFG
jgi:HAMP domain-containing protein